MDFEKEFYTNGGGLWIKYMPPYKIYIWGQRMAYSIPAISGLSVNDYSAFELSIYKESDNSAYLRRLSNEDMISLGLDLSLWNFSDQNHGAYVPRKIVENIISILLKLQEEPVIGIIDLW